LIRTIIFFLPDYMATVERLRLKEAGGRGIASPDWSAAASLEMMDRYGIRAAVVSIASPGV